MRLSRTGISELSSDGATGAAGVDALSCAAFGGSDRRSSITVVSELSSFAGAAGREAFVLSAAAFL